MTEYSNLGSKDTRSGFGEALLELGKSNPDVVALCADLTGSVKMDAFAKAFPDRFFQAGIAEANMIGVAAGLALGGQGPVLLLVRGVHHRALRPDQDVGLLLGRQRAHRRQPRRRRHRRGRLLAEGARGHRGDASAARP